MSLGNIDVKCGFYYPNNKTPKHTLANMSLEPLVHSLKPNFT